MLLRSFEFSAGSVVRQFSQTLLNRGAAGASLNNDINFKKKPENSIISALEQTKINDLQDWSNLRKNVLSEKGYITITEANVDGMIMASIAHLNRVDLGRSYLSYLDSVNTVPNLATVGSYLKLIYETYKRNPSKIEGDEIIRLCKMIQQKYPVLESQTLNNMILALSLTKEWRLGLELMQEITKTSKVSGAGFSALASAAFRNKDEPLAWDLLRQGLSEEKSPQSVAYLSYLETLKRKRKMDNISKGLEKLFVFFKETELHCPEEVASTVVDTFATGQKATVTFSGHCRNCDRKLKKLELTDAEFTDLQNTFFKKAIIGKDIFLKTNPLEMAKFEKFVSSMGKYDVVLDGLNIAYSTGVQKGPHVFSRNLAAVVSHFVQQNKSILVLGRVHMEKWPRSNWNYIKQNSSIFLTQNISQDDPYLLYCALRSGKDTIICSRDLMRGHKFLLKDQKCKVLFNRWLTQRQYFLLTVADKGKVIFKTPPDFSAIAQEVDGIWHVPYTSEKVEVNESYHKTWLCLNKC